MAYKQIDDGLHLNKPYDFTVDNTTTSAHSNALKILSALEIKH